MAAASGGSSVQSVARSCRQEVAQGCEAGSAGIIDFLLSLVC